MATPSEIEKEARRNVGLRMFATPTERQVFYLVELVSGLCAKVEELAEQIQREKLNDTKS